MFIKIYKEYHNLANNLDLNHWSFVRKTLLGDNPDPEKSELL